jgi:hypothetical protein
VEGSEAAGAELKVFRLCKFSLFFIYLLTSDTSF